jgi:hypothetical protein
LPGATPADEAALAKERQDNDDYYRRLAAEVVTMLPYVRSDALTVLSGRRRHVDPAAAGRAAEDKGKI